VEIFSIRKRKGHNSDILFLPRKKEGLFHLRMKNPTSHLEKRKKKSQSLSLPGVPRGVGSYFFFQRRKGRPSNPFSSSAASWGRKLLFIREEEGGSSVLDGGKSTLSSIDSRKKRGCQSAENEHRNRNEGKDGCQRNVSARKRKRGEEAFPYRIPAKGKDDARAF